MTIATQIVLHTEIPAGGDTARSRALWGALFGWQFTEVPGSPAEYFHTTINEEQGVTLPGSARHCEQTRLRQ